MQFLWQNKQKVKFEAFKILVVWKKLLNFAKT